MQDAESIPLKSFGDSRPVASRVLAASGVTLLAAGAGAVAYFDPTKTNFLPVCPLLSMTGFACPGCGLTRGFHALFNGDIIPALDFNFLIPVWMAIFGWIFMSLVLTAIRGRGLQMWMTRPGVLGALAVTLIGFGVLRNIPIWPLTILFP